MTDTAIQVSALTGDGLALLVFATAVFALPGDGTDPDPRRPWMRSCEDSAPRTNRPWIPSIRTASREVRRLVAVLAMLRNGGNVSVVTNDCKKFAGGACYLQRLGNISGLEVRHPSHTHTLPT